MTRPIIPPRVGDPVVDRDDHTKYRIRELAPHAAHLAAAGPYWRTNPVVRLADPGRLEWDNVAGLWRGPSIEVQG
jgi:hypothetical protein